VKEDLTTHGGRRKKKGEIMEGTPSICSPRRKGGGHLLPFLLEGEEEKI